MLNFELDVDQADYLLDYLNAAVEVEDDNDLEIIVNNLRKQAEDQ